MPSGLSQSMETSFGSMAPYAVVTLVFLALLVLVTFLTKRIKQGGAMGAGRSRGPRLAVIDMAAVDQRRKLVLVRRDEVEHLVLIGGQNDLVIEGGILRAPVSARQAADDRAGELRVEHPVAAVPPPEPSVSRPVVVAPEPRRQPAQADIARQSSPLRRPIPRQEPRQVLPGAKNGAANADLDVASPRAPMRAERSPTPPSPPAPLLEPAILDEAPPAFVSREATVQPSPSPVVEPRRPQPIAQPAPTNAPVARPPAPSLPDRERNEPGPEIPAFLKRGEPAAAGPAPKEAEPARPPDPMPMVERRPLEPATEDARVAVLSPVAAARPAASADTLRATTFEPPLVGPAEPVRPIPGTAPAAREPQIVATPPAAPTPPLAPAVPRPAPTEPLDEAERRPLSVRSFASAIQSRRSPPEAQRAVPPAPPTRQPPPEAGDDPLLEDQLSRELDNGFGSLDWGVQRNDDTAAPRRDPAPAAPPAEQQPNRQAERRLTIEEEMERLLGDFDVNAPRR